VLPWLVLLGGLAARRRRELSAKADFVTATLLDLLYLPVSQRCLTTFNTARLTVGDGTQASFRARLLLLFCCVWP
jgi:hypothetical protein